MEACSTYNDVHFCLKLVSEGDLFWSSLHVFSPVSHNPMALLGEPLHCELH